MLLSLLLFLLLILPSCQQKQQKDELILVQMMVRHAERAGLTLFTNRKSWKLLFRGLGEISDNGLSRAHAQGEFFREKYVDSQFVDRTRLDEQVRVRACALNRCIMSAGAFANGLAANDTQLPIHTVEIVPDETLLLSLNSREWLLSRMRKYNIWGRRPFHPDLVIPRLVELNDYEECKGISGRMIEASMAETKDPRAKVADYLQECIDDYGRKLMFKKETLLAGAGAEFDGERLKDSVGNLLTILRHNIVNAINGVDTGKKMRIYYTTDVMLMALNQAMDTIQHLNSKLPELSAVVTLELWRRGKEHYIRIFLKNGHVADNKEIGDLPWSSFDAQISQYTNNQTVLELDVTLTHPSATFVPDLEPHLGFNSTELDLDFTHEDISQVDVRRLSHLLRLYIICGVMTLCLLAHSSFIVYHTEKLIHRVL